MKQKKKKREQDRDQEEILLGIYGYETKKVVHKRGMRENEDTADTEASGGRSKKLSVTQVSTQE